MSDQDNTDNGSLVPSGRRDLAPIADANPLVSRGLVDVAKMALSPPSASPNSPAKISADIIRRTANLMRRTAAHRAKLQLMIALLNFTAKHRWLDDLKHDLQLLFNMDEWKVPFLVMRFCGVGLTRESKCAIWSEETLEEIGERLDLTREQMREIESEALSRSRALIGFLNSPAADELRRASEARSCFAKLAEFFKREDEKPVARFKRLSQGTRECLDRLGIHSFNDLASCTADELLKETNFGMSSLTEIRLALACHGLMLQGE